jgi:hypothetical protein
MREVVRQRGTQLEGNITMSRWLRALGPVIMLVAVFLATTVAWNVARYVITSDRFHMPERADLSSERIASAPFLALHFVLSAAAAILVGLWLVRLRPTPAVGVRTHLRDCLLLYVTLGAVAATWHQCGDGCGLLLYGSWSTWAFTALGGILGHAALTARLRQRSSGRAV